MVSHLLWNNQQGLPQRREVAFQASSDNLLPSLTNRTRHRHTSLKYTKPPPLRGLIYCYIACYFYTAGSAPRSCPFGPSETYHSVWNSKDRFVYEYRVVTFPNREWSLIRHTYAGDARLMRNPAACHLFLPPPPSFSSRGHT